MNTKILHLPLPDGTLELVVDIYGRTRCTLAQGDRRRYLGSGLIEEITRRIVKEMARSAGESEEGTLRTVLSLADARHRLCARRSGEGREIVFQDSRGEAIGAAVLSGEQCRRWSDILQQ